VSTGGKIIVKHAIYTGMLLLNEHTHEALSELSAAALAALLLALSTNTPLKSRRSSMANMNLSKVNVYINRKTKKNRSFSQQKDSL